MLFLRFILGSKMQKIDCNRSPFNLVLVQIRLKDENPNSLNKHKHRRQTRKLHKIQKAKITNKSLYQQNKSQIYSQLCEFTIMSKPISLLFCQEQTQHLPLCVLARLLVSHFKACSSGLFFF